MLLARRNSTLSKLIPDSQLDDAIMARDVAMADVEVDEHQVAAQQARCLLTNQVYERILLPVAKKTERRN